ncbi:metal-sensitive transcriptional regulator [Nocardioides pacificus]
MTRTEPGYITDQRAVLSRLHRIEGQIRGLQRMVTQEVYCPDVLIQVSAATRALESVALTLLDQHLRHCVGGAPGDVLAEQRLADASAAIARLVRS